MWVSRDERKLLLGYYFKIAEVGKELRFDARSWHRVLGACMRPPFGVRTLARLAKIVPEYEDDAEQDTCQTGVHDLIAMDKRLSAANRALEARGLVRVDRHDRDEKVFGVKLTVQGYDLGRKYACWFSRTGEWFSEYKDHWLWLVLSLLGGALAGGVVSWILR